MCLYINATKNAFLLAFTCSSYAFSLWGKIRPYQSQQYYLKKKNKKIKNIKSKKSAFRDSCQSIMLKILGIAFLHTPHKTPSILLIRHFLFHRSFSIIILNASNMSTILTDRLLADNSLRNLEDYGISLVARLNTKFETANYPQDVEISIRSIQSLYRELNEQLAPFLRSCSKRDALAKKQDIGYDSIDPASQITDDTISHINSILARLSEDMTGGRISLPEECPEIASMVQLMLILISMANMLSLGKFLLSTTLPLVDDIAYYDNVRGSSLAVGIYTVQTFPSTILALLSHLYVKLAAQHAYHTVREIPSWVPCWFKVVYQQWMKWIAPLPNVALKNVSTFLQSPAAYVVSRQKYSHSIVKMFITSTVGLPFLYASSRAKYHRKALARLRTHNIRRIGYLIDEILPLIKFNGSSVLKFNHQINVGLKMLCGSNFDGKSDENARMSHSVSDDLTELTSICQTHIPSLKHSTHHLVRHHNQPSFLTRFWPLALIGYKYVPEIVQQVVNNREAAILWIRTNIVETVSSFARNWIVKPLVNIWKTIRHDDSSKIAITSKNSLNSDLEALERMTVDYCVENYSYFTDVPLTEANRETLVKNITAEVRSGNMDKVMRLYEQNLKTPMKAIINGNMVRNILIQVQKTKVDGDVALSGIDKIMQSQELVFGLVAASPACLVVWYIVVSTRSYLRNGYLVRFTRNHRQSALKSMNTLEKLVGIQLQISQGEQLKTSTFGDRYFNNGLIYMELINLRRQTSYIFPTFLQSDWIRDMNDVLATSQFPELRLNTIRRIWNVYGSYLK